METLAATYPLCGATRPIRNAAALSAYTTYEEADDAFGWGEITEAEFMAITDQLVSGRRYVVESKTKAGIALQILRSYERELSAIITELTFELLPPAEKARRLQSSHEFDEKMARLKAQRRERTAVD